MFKKPEDISPLPAGMMDAFTKSLNTQLGNYNTAQEAPAPEAPSAEADIPKQQVEESVEVEEAVIAEDNTNDKSDDGEGLDKVQPKAVKKKFKDRKDKDIDNDGDTDDSDEYLHKRRKAISKALTKESAEELAELKNTHAVIDTAQGGKVVSVATNEKGAKSSIVSAEKPPMNIKDKKTLKVVQLKKPISRNKDILGTVLKASYYAEETGDLGKPEGFFSEEMDPTDHVRFNKETNMFCVYDKDGKKVYESEKEEEANAYATDNNDAMMGKNDLEEISGKLNKKGEIEMTKANFAKVHKDYKTKIKGQPYAMQIDPKSGGSALFPVKFIKESVELDEKYQQFTDKTPNWGEGEALTYGRKKGYKEVAVMGDGKGVHAMVLFALNAEDKKFVRSANVKSGETVFRYTTKISIAGDIFPLVKVNIAKGIFYPLTQESSDGSIETAKFETRGVKLKFFRSLEGVKLESLGSEDESKVKEIIGKLKGASKAHAGQAKDLEKAVNEEVKIKEGNAFTKALAAARLNGDDEFIVSGKKYKVTEHNEDLDEALRNPYKGKSSSDLKRKLSSFESQLQDLIKKSKGRSRREIEGEIRDMETKVQQVRSALKEDLDLDEGFSNFAVPIPKQTLNGKKIGGGKTPIVVKARSTREAITKAAKQLGVDFKFLKTGKVVKEAIDPADMDDMKATKGDKESAKMNIIVQLRKAADVKGNLDIVFADGKKQKLPVNIIKIALDKYNSFRKPATKKKLVDGMSKSYRSMLQTLKTIKEYSEESGSKES